MNSDQPQRDLIASFPEPPLGSTSGEQPSGRTVRCPHCHNPIRLADDRSDEVLCPGCGSTFRLADTRLTDTTAPMRRLGKFQFLERVGLGAFGAVWKARDTELDRIVALKIPHAGLLSSPEAGERFAREARAAAQLRHPGIVSVHEVLTLDGVPAIVADFIDGLTLRDLCAVRPLTFRESAELVAQLAEALDYAHTLGLVHRDVKPGNIMVEQHQPGGVGRPLLMDFGLALRDEIEVTLTLDGQVLGTPAYMSPEQAAGQGHRVDRRSDVYSLGVILYELLCGELPFRGTKQVILHQVRHEEPRPPRRLNDRIPRDLETIALKAMAKEPNRRYRSAADFGADLRRFLRGEPIQARPVDRLERLGRWCRRNPALAASTGLAATALLAVTVLAVVVAVITNQSNAELADANSTLADANTNLVNEQQETKAVNKAKDIVSAHLALSLEDKQQQLSLMAFQRAHALIEERELPQALLWLGRALELAPPRAGDLQRVIRINLSEVRAELITLKAVILSANRITTVAFSPDGKTFLTAEGGISFPETGVVRFWDTATARPRQPIITVDGTLQRLALSPDGKTLLTAGKPRPGSHFGRPGVGVEEEANLWDVATGKKLVPPMMHPIMIWTTAFSPDGKTLLTTWGLGAPGGGEGRLWSAATGKMIGQPLAHETVVHSAAFSPDGKLVLTGCVDGTARLWDAATARPLSPPLPHPGGVSRVAFSPDGSKFLTAGGEIASGGGETHLRLWRTADQKPIGQPIPCAGQAAFSPDGKLVILAGAQGGLRFYDPTNATQIGMPIPIGGVQFSPDGRWLAGADTDGFFRLWEVPSGNPVGPSMRHLGQVGHMAFSPDGRYLLTTGGDMAVRLWELPAGRLREIARPQDDPELHYSADRRVAWRRHGDRDMELVDPAAGRSLGLLQHPFRVMDPWFSPDGKTLAVYSGDRQQQLGELRFWDTATARPIGTPIKVPSSFIALTFSPDSKAALVTWERYEVVRLGLRTNKVGACQLWQIATGKSRSEPLPPGGESLSGAFSADSQRLAIHWFDSEKQTSHIRLWNTATTADSGAFQQAGAIHGPIFSPDSRLLATAGIPPRFPHLPRQGSGEQNDKIVRLWDAATAAAVGQPLRLPWTAEHLMFSSDSKVLFASTSNAGGLQAWDIGTRKSISELTWHDGVATFLYSPDRKIFTVRTRQAPSTSTKDNPDRTLAFLDACTGRLLGHPLEHQDRITAVSFGPDSKTVLTGSQDRSARLWEVSSGKPLTPPLVHQGPVSEVAFSPDARILLTVSNKSTVRLWQASTGKVIGQPLAHPDELVHVDFSPDGRFVRTIAGKGGRPFRQNALAGRVGTARFWDATTGLPLGMPAAISLPVQFPADGAALLARLDGRHALSWELPPPITGASAQVACWTQVLTGMELSPDGVLGALDGSAVAERRDRLESLGGPPGEVADAGERLRAGDRLAILQGTRDRQWIPVLWHVERLLDAYPQDMALRYLRGQAHFELGHWSQGVSDLTAAIEAQAAGPEVWYQRGWACAYLGQTDAALRDFTRALQERPKDPAVLLAQYFVHSRRGEWDLAEADRVAAFSNMGAVQFAGDRSGWEQAVTAHTRALEAGLNEWWVWSGRAVGHWGLGRWKEAAADFAEALERKPDDSRLWNLRCVLHYRFRQYDQAIADSTRALELKKDDPVLWLNRATNYAHTRQWEKASADYSKALELQPKNLQARAARGDAEAQLQHWDKAAADYAGVIAQGANYPEMWHRLALVRLQLGEDTGYRAACADLVRRFGRAATIEFGNTQPPLTKQQRATIELANTLAWTCALAPDALADPNIAVQFALGAVNATESVMHLPGLKAALQARLYMNTLGAAYYRASHFELAVKALDKVVASQREGSDWLRRGQKDLSPLPAEQREGGTAADWLLLAMAHHRLGHAALAKAWLDRAVQWLEQSTRDKPKDDSFGATVSWETWAELQLLRREAENLDASDKKALAALDRATKDKPKEAAGWVERARFHKYRRHHEQAEADYTRAIEVEPDNPVARSERGRFYSQQRQWDKAAADFLKVVELRPKNLQLRLECSQACAESKQWEHAAAQFEKARELANVPTVVWYYQALAHLGAGQMVEYRRLCARMLDARGPGAPPPMLIVQTCRAAPEAVTDFAPVLKLAEQLAAAQPGSYPVLRLHGQLLYRAGQFEAALQQLDRALKARPGRLDLSYATDALYLAMAHQRLDRGPEARQWLQRGVQVIEQVERDRQKVVTAANVPEPWFNRLVVQRLRQEAEGLVK